MRTRGPTTVGASAKLILNTEHYRLLRGHDHTNRIAIVERDCRDVVTGRVSHSEFHVHSSYGTKPTLLATGIILGALGTSWGQPVITNQPTPQATAPGTTVTFQVGASSIEPLAYQWQKNPGNGFSDLADRTNAALVLANVQPWDAGDYRVVVTNITGVRTSAVARLYVVRPGLVTTNVVIDNFDDNRVTGWIGNGQQVDA